MRRLLLLLLVADPARAQTDYLTPWSAYVGGLEVAKRCGIVLEGAEAGQFLDNMRLLGNHARKKLADGGMSPADIDAAMDRRRATLAAEAEELTREGCRSEDVRRVLKQHKARAQGGLSAH